MPQNSKKLKTKYNYTYKTIYKNVFLCINTYSYIFPHINAHIYIFFRYILLFILYINVNNEIDYSTYPFLRIRIALSNKFWYIHGLTLKWESQNNSYT